MRLLHVINSLHPSNGGPVEGIREMSLEQIRQGHSAHVLTLDAPNSPGHDRFHAQIIALGPSGPQPFCLNFRLIPWLSQQRDNYDAVLVHGIWDYSTIGAWLALRGSQTPFFVYAHGMLDPWFRTNLTGYCKKSIYWLLLGRHIFREAHGILYLTEAERHLARYSFSPYLCRELLAPHGTQRPGLTDTAREAFLRHFPQVRGRKVLLFLGRIHPKKGVQVLLDAFAEASVHAPSLHLVIAGTGDPQYLQLLQADTAEADLQHRITWTGYLTDHLRAGAFAVADAFILPSHGENFALSAVEALARGVPVLLSKRVNIVETVVQENAGFSAADNVEATRAMIHKWSQLSPETQLDLRRRARMCFEKHWEISRACRALMRVLGLQANAGAKAA